MSDTPDRISLSKADVIQRQLDTAIFLWFHDQDPVSIQALASGALKVCHDVGAPSDFITLQGVPPEQREKLKKQLMEAQNFFKHARDDADKILSFAPVISEFFIYETILRFHRLFGRMSINMLTFGLRFTLVRPASIFEGLPERPPIPFVIDDLRQLAKDEFYAVLVPYFAETMPLAP